MPLITCSALRRVLLDYKTQGGRKYWQKNLIRTNIWTICFNTPKFSNKRTAQFFKVGKRCLIDVAPERIIWQVWAWKPEIFSCRRISIVLCTCQVPRGLPKCCSCLFRCSSYWKVLFFTARRSGTTHLPHTMSFLPGVRTRWGKMTVSRLRRLLLSGLGSRGLAHRAILDHGRVTNECCPFPELHF